MDDICRHAPGDTSCSSHPDNVESRRREYENEEREREEKAERKRRTEIEDQILKRVRDTNASTPDADKFEILAMERVGKHVIFKVQYPNCIKCSYEGIKILVYLNVTE